MPPRGVGAVNMEGSVRRGTRKWRHANKLWYTDGAYNVMRRNGNWIPYDPANPDLVPVPPPVRPVPLPVPYLTPEERARRARERAEKEENDRAEAVRTYQSQESVREEMARRPVQIHQGATVGPGINLGSGRKKIRGFGKIIGCGKKRIVGKIKIQSGGLWGSSEVTQTAGLEDNLGYRGPRLQAGGYLDMYGKEVSKTRPGEDTRLGFVGRDPRTWGPDQAGFVGRDPRTWGHIQAGGFHVAGLEDNLQGGGFFGSRDKWIHTAGLEDNLQGGGFFGSRDNGTHIPGRFFGSRDNGTHIPGLEDNLRYKAPVLQAGGRGMIPAQQILGAMASRPRGSDSVGPSLFGKSSQKGGKRSLKMW